MGKKIKVDISLTHEQDKVNCLFFEFLIWFCILLLFVKEFWHLQELGLDNLRWPLGNGKLYSGFPGRKAG